MSIVDGNAIANELKSKLKSRIDSERRYLSLGIIVVEETPAIRQFVTLKERFGKSIGVKVEVIRPTGFSVGTKEVLELLLHSTRNHDGIIVQLPLPLHVFLEDVLKIYPLTHDVDVLGFTAYQQFKEGNLPFLPPVIGAFDEILRKHEVKLAGKKVVIVGEGKLVGAPSAVWAERLAQEVCVVTKETLDVSSITKTADVLILGAGSPGLIQKDMVKEGVVILDAGSGEDAGVIKGDADPLCAEVASLFTPTPGGIGPITVAKVFENLVLLDEIKHPKKL